MGNNTSQTIKSNQQVVNSMLQAADQNCTFNCQNSLSGLVIVVIGGNGNITIAQECKMDNLQCIMSNSFDAQIEDILKAMLQQSASSMNGFSLDFANVSQNVDLEQYILNTITQTMNSSCTFDASNDASGIYTYAQDRNGDITLSQSSTISNSTCNMNNIAKAVTYNNESGQAGQKSTILNIFSLLFIIVIIGIIVVGIVMVVFIATGGVATVAGVAGEAAKSGAGGTGKAGGPAAGAAETAASGSNLSSLVNLIAANPELLAV